MLLDYKVDDVQGGNHPTSTPNFRSDDERIREKVSHYGTSSKCNPQNLNNLSPVDLNTHELQLSSQPVQESTEIDNSGNIRKKSGSVKEKQKRSDSVIEKRRKNPSAVEKQTKYDSATERRKKIDPVLGTQNKTDSSNYIEQEASESRNDDRCIEWLEKYHWNQISNPTFYDNLQSTSHLETSVFDLYDDKPTKTKQHERKSRKKKVSLSKNDREQKKVTFATDDLETLIRSTYPKKCNLSSPLNSSHDATNDQSSSSATHSESWKQDPSLQDPHQQVLRYLNKIKSEKNGKAAEFSTEIIDSGILTSTPASCSTCCPCADLSQLDELDFNSLILPECLHRTHIK